MIIHTKNHPKAQSVKHVVHVWNAVQQIGLDLWVLRVTGMSRFRALYNHHLYTLGVIPLGVWLRVLALDEAPV